MKNTSNHIIYAVNSDLDDGLLYAEFENKDAAIDYAKQHLDKLPFVDELEVSYDANGEIDDVFSYTTIWDHTMTDQETEATEADAIDTEDDYWDFKGNQEVEAEKNKYDLGDTTWFESMNNLVETLEENEDEVECKECFNLFPKADCIKLDIGYVCPTCARNGVISETDIFNIDFPEYKKVQNSKNMNSNKPTIVNNSEEVVPAESESETATFSTPEEAVPFLINDEKEAIEGYEQAAEVVEASDVENKEEILDVLNHIKAEEEEHIEELTELSVIDESEDSEAETDPISKDEIEEIEDPEATEPAALVEDAKIKTWICWYEGSDIGTVEAATEEEATELMMSTYPEYQYNNTDWGVELADEEYLTEHVNAEHPAVESNQELSGTDNAVVGCKVANVVTHSEDETPVDCKGKKKPLEKPLTETKCNPVEEQLDITQGSSHIKSVATLVHTAVEKLTKDNRVGTRADGMSFYVLSDKRSADPEKMKEVILNTLAANGYEPDEVQFIDRGQVYGYVIGKLKASIRTRLMASYQKRDNRVAESVEANGAHRNIVFFANEIDAHFNKKYEIEILDGYKIHIIDETTDLTKEINSVKNIAANNLAAKSEKLSDGTYAYMLKNKATFTEETHAQYAKPADKRVQAYNNALKYAKQYNTPFIYGYTNYIGKFFALDQPIKVTGDPAEAEKELRDKYINCNIVYVAYPNKSFVNESAEEDVSQPVKMANTAGISGMDFEAACSKFGVNLED